MDSEISQKEKLLRVVKHVGKKHKVTKPSNSRLTVEDIPSDQYADTLLGKRYKVSNKVVQLLNNGKRDI